MTTLTRMLLAAVLTTNLAGAAPAGASLGLRQGGERPLEIASGAPARLARDVIYGAAPAARRAAWQRFDAQFPGWLAMWDEATEVPLRLWGKGVAAPGSVASPAAAEAAARAALAAHLDLLAPGAKPDDFELVANEVWHGLRSVGFRQSVRAAGVARPLPVIRGQLGFAFKNDRLFVISSQALPDVPTPIVGTLAGDALTGPALAWIRSFADPAARVRDVRGPVVLPIIRDRVARRDGAAAVDFVTAQIVRVDSRRPLGRWDVYVDAATGQPLAREQLLRSGAGTLHYDAPVRHPGGERLAYPAVDATVQINGASAVCTADGAFTWAGNADATLSTRVSSALVRVENDAGGLASTSLSVADGGTALWTDPSEAVEAQINTFIHIRRAKEYVRGINPDLAWIDEQQIATVNIAENCNALSDGANELYFFHANNECANTGQISDVVHHETGHSVHGQSVIPGIGEFEGGLSEGVSDYLAATIVNDSGMGRGFFFDDEPLRELDPVGDEWHWPEDGGESHNAGRIIGGTLWDVRKAMIAAYGQDDGVVRADLLYYAVIQRSSDIPSTFVEALAFDDDDGDLANGTPNGCALTQIFTAHGLASPDSPGALRISPPERDGYAVSIAVTPPVGDCVVPLPVGATLSWRTRGASDDEVIDLSVTSDGFAGLLPTVDEGQVVQYKVEVELDDGSRVSYPDNRADPYYELFVGGVTEIYCTDFESDPAAEGWSHGLSAGTPAQGADDWTWGAPFGVSGSGDPSTSFSPTRAFGNDLGGLDFNGLYQSEKTNFASSPMIDVSGYDNVRLQYRRWLNVEDGAFDHATIYANGDAVWSNFDSDQGNDSNVHHTDKEWRFQDVDLSEFVQGGMVQLTWELASDPALELGGWTLDDVCVVAYQASVCGDGEVTGNEACDGADANSDSEPDACRADCVAATCGDGVTDSDEACDDGNDVDDDACSTSCVGEEDDDGDGEDGGCCSASDRQASSSLLLGLAIALGLGLPLRRRRRSRTT